MDYKTLASNLGIDEDDFRELVELFVTVTLAELDKIRQGVASGSPKDVVAASHSIKGAAGNLGFESMAELANKMEIQAHKGSLGNFNTYISDFETQVNALTIS